MRRFNSDPSYMRLTKDLVIGKNDFYPYMKFYKDGVEFGSFNIELLQDLTFILDKDSPFYEVFKGPELSAKDAFEEIFHMLKNQLNEPSLDDELRELLHAKYEKKTQISGEERNNGNSLDS